MAMMAMTTSNSISVKADPGPLPFGRCGAGAIRCAGSAVIRLSFYSLKKANCRA